MPKKHLHFMNNSIACIESKKYSRLYVTLKYETEKSKIHKNFLRI